MLKAIANKEKFFREELIPYGKETETFSYYDSYTHTSHERREFDFLGEHYVVLIKNCKVFDIIH